MVHIGYFSLLLFFISANIIDGMENSMDITTFEARKLEARKKELVKLPSPCIPGLEFDSKTGKFFQSELAHTLLQRHQPNNLFGKQIGKQSNSVSSLKRKLEARKKELAKLPNPCIPGLELDPETDKFFQSEPAHTLLQRHQPNNPFGKQIEKQSNSVSFLRKKRKITDIAKQHSTSQQPSFENFFNNILIERFRCHSNSRHPNILSKKNRRDRIKNHLQQPGLVSINCPEPGCKQKITANRKSDLERNFVDHYNEKHKNNITTGIIAKSFNQLSQIEK